MIAIFLKSIRQHSGAIRKAAFSSYNMIFPLACIPIVNVWVRIQPSPFLLGSPSTVPPVVLLNFSTSEL